jgi:dihydropteroate synthase
LGAAIVNDVGAGRGGGEMWDLVAASGAGYVVMHMQGTPQTMQTHPHYSDVVEEVGSFFKERLDRLAAAGIHPEQAILDAGLGVGKSPDHNLRLLAAHNRFIKWKRPLLLGASRKSFIAAVARGVEAAGRMPGSLAAACWAVQAGADIVRVHDVAATRQALAVTRAILDRTST